MNNISFRKTIRGIVETALREDVGLRDVTTELVIEDDLNAEGIITAEEDIVLAGIGIAEEVFKALDPEATFEPQVKDGEDIQKGTVVARTTARARSLLSGERVALNFLQRLSGIATLSRKYAKAVADLPVRIVDTRKTTPGLRVLEKYAVRIGGCVNHRYGLFDGVLIKENHLALTGGIKGAIGRLKDRNPFLKVEVEVQGMEDVKEAVSAGVDIIMLDNMDVKTIREAVEYIREHKGKRILIEASGGMNLDRIREVALTGVDIISVGAITHSASWVNISMDITGVKN